MGSLLTLQGAGAYDAAVHCASVSAARRILQQNVPGATSSSGAGVAPLGEAPRQLQASGSLQGHPGNSSGLPLRSLSYPGDDRREPNKRRFRGVANKLRLAIVDLIGSKSSTMPQGQA